MTDQAAIEALAEAWAEYEHALEADQHHQLGEYRDEALELVHLLRSRGYDIVKIGENPK